jgi:hypothetical protein
MTFGIVSWMRRVLPRSEIVVVGIGIEMLVECLYLATRLIFGFADEEGFRLARFGWLLFCAMFYGMHRIFTFHPAADADYRRWLELTPWTAEKPLPGGPLQLVPQDLLVVCVLTLLFRERSLQALYIPTAFLFGYQLTLAIFARLIGHWGLAYLIAFVLGAVVYFADRPEAAFAMTDGCFIIGRIAVGRALGTFPWELPWQAQMQTFKAVHDEQKRRRLGWPFDQLVPKTPQPLIPFHDGICLSFLAGWWWFIVLSQSPLEARSFIPLVMIMVVLFGGIMRLAQYVISHRSPLDFFGRLFTFRWIIPSYDKIAIAPFLALVTIAISQGLAAWMMFPRVFGIGWNTVPGTIVAGLGLTAALLLLLVAGPGVERWRLAARHRIVFDLAGTAARSKSDEFVEL